MVKKTSKNKGYVKKQFNLIQKIKARSSAGKNKFDNFVKEKIQREEKKAKREQNHLAKEIKTLGSQNITIDKRKDKNRMVEHFGSRKIFGEKRSLFDLDDEEAEEPTLLRLNTNLTHKGQDIEELDYKYRKDSSDDDEYQQKLMQSYSFVGANG